MPLKRYVRGWLSAGLFLIASLFLAVFAVRLTWLKWQARNPHFHDGFNWQSSAQPRERGWQAFGGAWQVLDGTMQNVSDDRGGKLVNGNLAWRDYMIQADVQLLSETGDAGFVARTNNEEIGVDAYHGYFAGLRDLDDTLIIGRADFGWHEFRATVVHSHVHTRTWYHLTMIVRGCVIAASAVTPEGERVVSSVLDSGCIQTGRFGLQSYSTGAIWQNLDLRPATDADLAALLGNQNPTPPDPPAVDSAKLPVDPSISNLVAYERTFGPMLRALRDNHADPNAQPIASLRLLAPNLSPHVTLHGVVTLVSPTLFIQDSSGGIAIPNPHLVIPVQIGDAVEASGDAEFHNFSSILRSSSVRLLWSHTQVPALAVTASQAATGSFDSQFVETEGTLASTASIGQRSVMLRFDEGSQSFVARAENLDDSAFIRALKPGSRLRVRGICVTDKAYTGNQVPFALLMRSAGDLLLLEPPPWWNTAHIVELATLLLVFSLCLHFAYAAFKRSRLRAVIEERERIAMEMHDTLAQSFAGLAFQLEALSGDAHPGSEMQRQLESTVDLVRFGHSQARREIAALRPGNLEQLGLPKAIEQAALKITQGTEIAVSLSMRGVPRDIPLRISDALFRIGQEAIANAVRHAKPHHIHLRVSFGKSSIMLEVHDDGRGFDPTQEGFGFGIRCMRERAERVGGAFRIHSTLGHGTRIAVRVRSPRPLLPAWWPRLQDLKWGKPLP
ncbi:MAG TPA: ATP-binding protein [Terracidiphilus sp.]|nr:ATP-binding protein [Terracidiphilus sp.]